jgi:hypothetical protein
MALLDTAESAYQLFETWIERFVLNNQSIIAPDAPLCLSSEALQETVSRFVENFRKGDQSFQDKLGSQLEGASVAVRHILAQAHWLWCFGIKDIGVETKKVQIAEILQSNPQELRQDIFIEGYQNGGTYHKQNKHGEVSTLLRIFEVLLAQKARGQLTTPQQVRTLVEQICLYGRHQVIPSDSVLAATLQAKIEPAKNAVYNILLHLANPSSYEPIVADNQKQNISKTFRALVIDSSGHLDQQLQEIRAHIESLPRFSGFTFSDHPEISAIWMQNQTDKLRALYQELGISCGPESFSDAELDQLIAEIRSGKRTAWFIKPGEKGSEWEECLRDYNIRFGWDSTLEQYFINPTVDEQALIEIMRSDESGVYQEKNPAKSAKTILSFVRELKEGDILIAASGRKALIGMGVVTETAKWNAHYPRHKTTRAVDWKMNIAKQPLLVEELQQKKGMLTMDTLQRIESADEAIKILALMQARQNGTLATRKQETVKYPLNQILYGPPGTGKTWQTIQYALGVLEGSSLATLAQEPRQVLIKRFKAYQQAGQIGFITFHASYAYEDFVQGLRPMLQTEGQLAFELKDGIFKELADQAKRNFLAVQNSGSKKPDFDTVFDSFMQPLLSGEEEEMLIPMKRKDAHFFITEITHASIKTRKQTGTSNHTLSLNTLEQMYYADQVIWKKSGLTPYYRPLLEKLHEHANQVQMEQEQAGITADNSSKNYVLIIDEINRANMSRVFGELITLLESDKRLGAENEVMMTLPSGDSFSLPPNLYLIGTMNTADKSIALVDIALRRRFHFIPVFPEAALIPHESWRSAFAALNALIRERKGADFQIGHAYFLNEDSLALILNNKVIPLLQEYFLNDLRTVKVLLAQVGWKTTETSWGGLQYLDE